MFLAKHERLLDNTFSISTSVGNSRKQPIHHHCFWVFLVYLNALRLVKSSFPVTSSLQYNAAAIMDNIAKHGKSPIPTIKYFLTSIKTFLFW